MLGYATCGQKYGRPVRKYLFSNIVGTCIQYNAHGAPEKRARAEDDAEAEPSVKRQRAEESDDQATEECTLCGEDCKHVGRRGRCEECEGATRCARCGCEFDEELEGDDIYVIYPGYYYCHLCANSKRGVYLCIECEKFPEIEHHTYRDRCARCVRKLMSD